MSRVEEFKKKRSIRRKYILAVLLLFFILTSGMMVVDSSINYLMSGRYGVELISLRSLPTHFEIAIMNKRIYINTRYIARDIEKLKNKFLGFAEN